MHEENKESFEEAVADVKSPLGWGKFILFILTYFGFAIILTFIPTIIVMVSVIIEGGNVEAELMRLATSPWMLYLDFLAFVFAILIFKSVRQFLKDAFSFQPMKKLSTYLYIIGAIGFMMLTQYLLIDVLAWDNAEGQVETFGFDHLTFDFLTVSILMGGMAIITPIKEEIIFRGVLHGFLSDRWNYWLGLFISSIIFGVLHLGYPISATIMGITFVVLYKLTRSLIAPIVLHIVWNAYALIGLIVYVNSL